MKMPLSTPVEAFMSTRLISIRSDEDVIKAADLMINHNIRHLVVVNPDGSLLGMVSIRDVLRELKTHMK
jgi:CBS domain-containing protein